MTALPPADRVAGFGQPLPFGATPALLLVDICRAYFEPGSPLRLDGAAMLANARALAAAARAAGAPVIWTRVEYAPGGTDGGLFYAKLGALRVWERGHPLGAFLPDFAPEPADIVVTKQYPSAFFGTSLAATLNTRRVDTVLVAGLSTSGCVRATALDALCHGFLPWVVNDACADRLAATHEQNLFDLESKYAELTTTAGALARLRRLAEASHAHV